MALALVLSLGLNGILFWKLTQKKQEFAVGANSQYGMPCIYTTSTRTLLDGQGSAFSCDVNGALILSN